MDESPEPRHGVPKQRPAKEYEDPHFHDEDEVVPPPEEAPRPAGPGASRPSRARKLPPPPRRFHED
jgi:hypothetical protein